MIADLDQLLKLRLVVARFGEMDSARWWNTRGQLGPLGATALRRGFPRTHPFARARSVFAVASQRCFEIFDPAGFVTLWCLPEALEEAFDASWERWLDNASEWRGFFEQLETLPPRDLPEVLHELAVVSDQDLQTFAALEVLPNGKSVSLPLEYQGTETDLALLALAFSLGRAGSLVVPYSKRFAS